jgi:hypothetical protein
VLAIRELLDLDDLPPGSLSGSISTEVVRNTCRGGGAKVDTRRIATTQLRGSESWVPEGLLFHKSGGPGSPALRFLDSRSRLMVLTCLYLLITTNSKKPHPNKNSAGS